MSPLNRMRKFVHTGVVWSVELQEVSPRPGRTTAALGLRAFLGLLNVPDVAHDWSDTTAPVPSLAPAPRDGVRDSKHWFRVPVMVLVADPFSCDSCPCQLKHSLAIPAEQSLVEIKGRS